MVTMFMLGIVLGTNGKEAQLLIFYGPVGDQRTRATFTLDPKSEFPETYSYSVTSLTSVQLLCANRESR